MFADNSDEATFQVADDDFSVALRLDAQVVAAVHAAFDPFVHLTVDLRQVVAGSRCHEDHYKKEEQKKID